MTHFHRTRSTDSFAALTKEKQAAFVLHVSHGSASEKIRAKAFESKQKTFFWSLELPSEDQPDTEKLSLEECTSIISANLAGYDGVIHQWTYRDAEVLPVKHWQVEHFVAMAKQIWEFKGDMATATETALSHIQKAIELQPTLDCPCDQKPDLWQCPHSEISHLHQRTGSCQGCLHQGC